MAADQTVDVLVVGAGVSGIGMAVRLKTKCPELSFCILERRADLGGTWDLFRFPGVRTDTHMWGYAYPFKPWPHKNFRPSAEMLKEYVRDTAKEFDVLSRIRFNQEVISADFNSSECRWLLTTASGLRFGGQFLVMAGGYFDYDPPFTPAFQGVQDFRGLVVHPQTWPEDLDYDGKRLAVIGSGATSVTMIPALSQRAASVTLVQRTPTFIFDVPSEPALMKFLQGVSPDAYVAVNRWGHFILESLWTKAVTSFPERFKNYSVKYMGEKLAGTGAKPQDYTPPYYFFEQRPGLSPEGDWFDAMQRNASIVTGHIDRFTETGLKMQDGRQVDADIIVTATGFNVHKNLPFGTMAVSVDGEQVITSTRMMYKGCMLTGVPNMAFNFGYLTGGSWTQKTDLTAIFVCRLLQHMRSKRTSLCVPVRDPSVPEARMHGFSSTYLARREDDLPKAGAVSPWDRHEDFLKDWYRLSWASVEDTALEFKQPARSRL